MGPRNTFRVPLRVVFYKQDGSWFAHCLEFDLAGDGETRDAALATLTEAIAIQAAHSLENNNAANLFSPADGKYFEMFAAGHEIAGGTLEVVTSLERLRSSSPIITGLDAREYEDRDEYDPQLALA